MDSYKVIGLMSGSSLDGLDIAYCQIDVSEGKYSYKFLETAHVDFPIKWQIRLKKLVLQNAVTYLKSDAYFGHFLGEKIREFIDENDLKEKVDFIASHGQTIFHQPENRFTSQIGDGSAIAVITGVPTIADFRAADVALGGQGAPVAPICDQLLFDDYKVCINLGGIGNITFKGNKRLVAYDICAVNMVLNELAGMLQLDYDKDGEIARSGQVNEELLNELDKSWYYEKPYPKSISGGWVTRVMFPIFRHFNISVEDKLRTAVEHIATQVFKEIKQLYEQDQSDFGADKALLTGGGAFNKFLVERMSAHSPIEMVVPDAEVVEFKEALLMALMGVLKMRGEINCLKEATGASRDSVGGVLFSS